LAVGGSLSPPQLLPPPGDGDIRQVFWELQNRSEIWLTLEPKTPKGERAPMLTFTFNFAGKSPAAPPTNVEVRAYAGTIYTPRSDLVFTLDGREKIDLSSGRLLSGTPSDYAAGTMTIAVLKQLAAASRVTGNALGFDFELTAAQRKAIAAFHDRITR
jgi:hypothetical protein